MTGLIVPSDGSLPSEAVATAETAATITSQIADRPLAKQAAEAQSQDAQEKSDEPSSQATPQEEPQAAAAEPQDAPVAVLNNDDSELDRVMMVSMSRLVFLSCCRNGGGLTVESPSPLLQLLEDVHAEYYRIFEAKLGHPADVKVSLRMKSRAFCFEADMFSTSDYYPTHEGPSSGWGSFAVFKRYTPRRRPGQVSLFASLARVLKLNSDLHGLSVARRYGNSQSRLERLATWNCRPKSRMW